MVSHLESSSGNNDVELACAIPSKYFYISYYDHNIRFILKICVDFSTVKRLVDTR